jgi:hypothetical protein
LKRWEDLGTRLALLVSIFWYFTASYSGFSSVLTIILNQETTKFTDKVDVTSVSEFFHSNAWLGACTAMSGAIGGQLFGLIADR